MEQKPDEILRDKENKIKLLFSEFESLKQKISVCEQERREDAGSRHNPQQRVTSRRDAPRQSLQQHRSDPSKEMLQMKIEKYEQLLREKTDLFEGKERYLNKALRQEKLSLETMKETYERKLRRAAKIVIPFTVEEIVGQIQLNCNAQAKLSVCQKRMACLAEMFAELRRTALLRLQRNAQEMDELIREKLELEIALTEKEELLSRQQDELRGHQSENRSGELMEKLSQIETERRQQTALLNQKIKELEAQLNETAAERDRAKAQYEVSVERLELQFREELKHMSKKQEVLQRAQKTASQTISKLQQSQRQQSRLLEETDLQLKKTCEELATTTTENEELKLQLDTLQRQMKLSTSDHESQLFTLNHILKQTKADKTNLEQELNSLKSQELRLREQGQKEGQQQTKELENKLRKSLQQIEQQKADFDNRIALLNSKISKLEDGKEEVSRRLAQKDSEVSRLNTELKKASQQQKGAAPPANKKEIEKYKSRIQELEIILEATHAQLDSQDSRPKGASELQAKHKQLSDEAGQIQKKLAEKDRQLEEHQRTIKRLQEHLSKLEAKQKILIKELEEKEHTIEDLKDKRAGFEKLALEIGKGNDELLKRKLPLDNCPRNNERHIVSGINDIQIRETNSDIEGEDRIDQGTSPRQVTMERGRSATNNMMYSYNLSSQRQLQEKIKGLERELELAQAEKEFLTAKVLVQQTQKQKLQEDVNSFEMDQERFEAQKEVLKQEVNRLNHELTSLKAEVKKLLSLLLVDNKKAFKGNLGVLKECFNRVCGQALPPGDLALLHLFTNNIDDKKGIFSIL